MRLDPYHPEQFRSHLGRAQYTARFYADAIASFPDHNHYAFLAAGSAQVRDVTEREAAFTVQAFLATMHYRQTSDVEHLHEGLLKAGLPA